MLAVMLLYARPAAAAWWAHSSACCTSGQCTIKAHHHQQHHSVVPERGPGHSMRCGHDMPGMTACSMSCCQDSDHAAVTSTIFVMPDVISSLSPASYMSSVTLAQLSDLLRSIEPLSPPPRFVSMAS
jgi:hypothetical protein